MKAVTRCIVSSWRNHVFVPTLLFIFPHRCETVPCLSECVRVGQIGAVRSADRRREKTFVPRPSRTRCPGRGCTGRMGLMPARLPARSLRLLVSWFRSIISQLGPSARPHTHTHTRLLHVPDSPSRTGETHGSLLVSDSSPAPSHAHTAASPACILLNSPG